MTQTFVDIADEFAAIAGWEDKDKPALAALRAIGEQLDAGELTGPMFAQWGLSHRALVKALASKSAAPKVDPLAELLTR